MTADPDVIFDVDLADDEPTIDELYERSAQEDYWDEVRDCCGGRSFWCVHFRSYPPPIERQEP
jgi:hypothetical protein